MYLVAAIVYLGVTLVGVIVYVTDSFGNSVENLISNFWISGLLSLANVVFYLYGQHENEKRRKYCLPD